MSTVTCSTSASGLVLCTVQRLSLLSALLSLVLPFQGQFSGNSGSQNPFKIDTVVVSCHLGRHCSRQGTSKCPSAFQAKRGSVPSPSLKHSLVTDRPSSALEPLGVPSCSGDPREQSRVSLISRRWLFITGGEYFTHF